MIVGVVFEKAMNKLGIPVAKINYQDSKIGLGKLILSHSSMFIFLDELVMPLNKFGPRASTGQIETRAFMIVLSH